MFSAARIPPLALLFELLSELNEFIPAPILQMLFSTHRAHPPFAQTHPFIRSDTKVIMSPDPHTGQALGASLRAYPVVGQ